MPSTTLIRAAFFTVGAVVGGGVVTALGASRRKEAVVVTSATPVYTGKTVDTPLIEAGVAGDPRISSIAGAAVGPVLKYGYPGPISDQLVRKAYVAAYDRRLRHPAWTAEHLTLASLGRSPEGGDRQKSTFQEDESLPVTFRARLQDYFRSGYDRGHMVPAADAKASQAAMDETFLLSNIAPQVGAGFNRHYWAYLEDWCRRLTGSFADVYVFTIPLYLPHKENDGKWRVVSPLPRFLHPSCLTQMCSLSGNQTYEMIGNPPNVAVPTHFAKVVLTSRPTSPSTPEVPEISTGAFVLPNASIPDDTPLESFVVPGTSSHALPKLRRALMTNTVEAVERAAGLTLFSDAIKAGSKHICKSTKCEVLVRRFDDAQKKPDMKKAISAPR
ncbi:hypothetical protein BV25DRAFT_1460950 [Artomyces pyxidatus]|uniref:Uncharacterized protein n=1 Tax=Artomyces pyxidatus TaxID=48021 RepID=A0ACB8SKN4_9AGAM|nr:hypothetical protein BV25DRAFT_1460950 [Artomyces pyxidatus]